MNTKAWLTDEWLGQKDFSRWRCSTRSLFNCTSVIHYYCYCDFATCVPCVSPLSWKAFDDPLVVCWCSNNELRNYHNKKTRERERKGANQDVELKRLLRVWNNIGNKYNHHHGRNILFRKKLIGNCVIRRMARIKKSLMEWMAITTAIILAG